MPPCCSDIADAHPGGWVRAVPRSLPDSSPDKLGFPALSCVGLCGAYCWGKSHPHSGWRLPSHRAGTDACPNKQAVKTALQLTVQRDQHTEPCRDPAAPRSEPERIQEGLRSPFWEFGPCRGCELPQKKGKKKKISPQLSFSCGMLRGCGAGTLMNALAAAGHPSHGRAAQRAPATPLQG